MIVHWFIEPVSYCKESASDIENPFQNQKCATQFCFKTLETDFKELKIFASHKNNFASDYFELLLYVFEWLELLNSIF